MRLYFKFNISNTWSVQKVSWILNFRGLRIFDFRLFCGVMLVLMSLTYANKLGRFQCSVNFWQLFCLDVFWLVFDFCLFQKMDQRICIKFCVKNKIKCADAFRMLTVAYGEATLNSLARHSGSPRLKKARQVRPNVKVLLTVFFDCRGVVHHEFLPQSRIVNKKYYLQVMRNLREAIPQKRPDLWKNENWHLHHDNAPAHTALLVRKFLAKNNTLMTPQPPYSPELAPCDFFLFLKLKRPMKGRRYATIEEIKAASKEELNKITKNDFLKCFEDWKKRWHKCIISDEDYFVRDKINIHEKINTFWKNTKFAILIEQTTHIQPMISLYRKSNIEIRLSTPTWS